MLLSRRVLRTGPAAATLAAMVLTVVPAWSAAPAPAPAGAAASPAQFLVPGLSGAGGSLALSRPGVSLTVGDFDNDGRDDVLVPVVNRKGVSVLRGRAGTAFAAPVITSLPAAGSVVAAATADFDGDGRLDAVAATVSDTGSPARVLLGRGTGGFDVGQSLGPTGSRVRLVAAADVNRDGRQDVAFVGDDNVTGSTVYVALGRGDGRFRTPVGYAPPFRLSVADLDLADVNGDAVPDLVYLRGCPVVRLGVGDGSFGPELCSSDPQGRLSGVTQAVRDLTGDGLPDLVLGDASGGHVTIATGDGAGRFTFLRRIDDVGGQVSSLTVGDFTGDGLPDVVVSADAGPSGPTNVSAVLRSRGGGAFAAPIRYQTGGDGVAPIDLDHDGRLDLVATGLRAGSVSAVRNDGGGRLHAPRAYVGLAGNDVPRLIQTGDVDGDGRADVVTTLAGLVTVWLRTPSGGLAAPVASEGPADRILSLALADLDGDGDLDAVAGTFAENNVVVLLGRGDGTFGPPTTYGNGSGAAVSGIAVGDVTGDGVPDVVSNTFTMLSVLAGRGDGTFGPPALSGNAAGDQVATLLGDVTGDGRTDAVSVVRSGTPDNAKTSVRVNRGRGDGTFAVGAGATAGTNAHAAALADITGDGRPDVALAGLAGTHTGRTGVFVLTNLGGSFGAPDYDSAPGFGLAVADLNGDGTLDAAADGPSELAVLTNMGDGSLTRTSTLPAGNNAVDVAAGDLAGGPLPDLVEMDATNPQQIVVRTNLSG